MGIGLIQGIFDQLRDLWPSFMATAHVVLALAATVHVILTKEEPRAAIGWIGLAWLSPGFGVVLYYLLGINRIRRKAVNLMRSATPAPATRAGSAAAVGGVTLGTDLDRVASVGDRIGGLALTRGNRVSPLVNGDAAYPAMLAAIRSAKVSVAMCSYIFDNDAAGQQFLRELADAVRRGVEVRVLIDATGAGYSIPSIIGPMRRAGVRVARFLPHFIPTRMSAINLRSHRKILVADGRLGYVGGMNIRAGNLLAGAAGRPGRQIQDVHFELEGPVVAHLSQTFIEDWAFTTREILAGDKWLPALTPAGDVLARGVRDGPDRDYEKILWTMLTAITSARHSIRIVTPYFLPDPMTARFLAVAAMAGVRVEIAIPERNNIRLIEWASRAVLPDLLRKSCQVWLTPPPFDHSKLMVVDDTWVFIGSANWDARSLRLNFEFNVECYDRGLAAQLNGMIDAKLAAGRRLRLVELERRGYPAKLRDGAVRLLAPYL